MKAKLFSLALSILLVTLGFVSTASANNVKIALTATFQDSVVPSGTITEYVARKVRITQKDVVARLGLVYPLPPEGGILYFSLGGSFYILNAEGTDILHSVDPGVLALAWISPWIRHGNMDTTPGSTYRTRNVTDGTLEMNVDAANFFALVGFIDADALTKGTGLDYRFKISMAGHGELDGDICILTGKIQIRIKTI